MQHLPFIHDDLRASFKSQQDVLDSLKISYKSIKYIFTKSGATNKSLYKLRTYFLSAIYTYKNSTNDKSAEDMPNDINIIILIITSRDTLSRHQSLYKLAYLLTCCIKYVYSFGTSNHSLFSLNIDSDNFCDILIVICDCTFIRLRNRSIKIGIIHRLFLNEIYYH